MRGAPKERLQLYSALLLVPGVACAIVSFLPLFAGTGVRAFAATWWWILLFPGALLFLVLFPLIELLGRRR